MSILASNAQPIDLAAANATAPAGGYSTVEHLPHWQLAEVQALTNWCWAATARAIRRYYMLSSGDFSLPDSQCSYVARQYGSPRPLACRNPQRATGQDCNSCVNAGLVDSALNLPGRLPELLRTDGHLDDSVFPRGYEAVSSSQPAEYYFLKIRAAVRQKRPVVLHFEKLTQNNANDHLIEGHFVVAFGFNRIAGTLDIWDPDPDREAPVLLSYLYQFGTLAHLIYTKP